MAVPSHACLVLQRRLQYYSNLNNNAWNIAQVQLQRLEQVQAEHGDLAARFEAAVTEARQAAGAEGLLAERRAGALEQALAQRQAELTAVLAAAGPAGTASAKAAGQQCEKVSPAAKKKVQSFDAVLPARLSGVQGTSTQGGLAAVPGGFCQSDLMSSTRLCRVLQPINSWDCALSTCFGNASRSIWCAWPCCASILVQGKRSMSTACWPWPERVLGL